METIKIWRIVLDIREKFKTKMCETGIGEKLTDRHESSRGFLVTIFFFSMNYLTDEYR